MSDPAAEPELSPEPDDAGEPAAAKPRPRRKGLAADGAAPRPKHARKPEAEAPRFEPALAEPPPVEPFDIPEGPPEPRDPRWIPPEKRLKAAAILFGCLFAAMFLWASWTLPLSRALKPLPEPTLLVLAANGQPIARSGSYKEAPVDVRKLPPHVRFAFLAIEDRRFYQHAGVDFQGLARALLVDLKHRRFVQGGSTITQQLAKNSFLDSRRTLGRKFQEMLIAFWIELRLSKNEILSRYLSSVYFGDGVYGLRAASRHYFDKPPEQLTISEAAMLAGVVNAPSRLAPSRNPAAARARSRLVLAAMVKAGVLDPKAVATLPPARPTRGREALPSGSYFADWVVSEARDDPDFGAAYGEVKVRTTLDPVLQRRAERVVANLLARRGDRAGAHQAALVAMRRDGRVLAMVGGRNYRESRFNRATQALRQPGSAFKPFVYLAAIRRGWRPDRKIDDTPFSVGKWTPENYDGRYRGRITLRQAFATSSNVAAVRLSEDVGRRAVIRSARDLGLEAELLPNPSLPLGTAQVTLLDLTGAYASVAAGLRPIEPRGLDEPQRTDLKRLDEKGERRPLLELMRATVNGGTGRAAGLGRYQVYGKTGTTQDYRDALFIGFVGDLVVGVWVGNDDETPMKGVTGGGLPAQVFHDFAAQALALRPELRRGGGLVAEALPQPDSLWAKVKRFFGFGPPRVAVIQPIEPPRPARKRPRRDAPVEPQPFDFAPPVEILPPVVEPQDTEPSEPPTPDEAPDPDEPQGE